MSALGRLGSIATLALAALTCGSSSTSSPGAPSQPSSNAFTITEIGVSPKSVTIQVGARVLFINNDSKSHNMASDPHPEHDQCPPINQVGFLNPGESRETGNFVTAETCGFHDHDEFSNQSLWGTIVVQGSQPLIASATAPGPGRVTNTSARSMAGNDAR